MASQDNIFGLVLDFPDGTQVERLMVAISTFERVATSDRMWGDLERVLHRNARRQFATEGGHGSGKWVKLSDAYRVRKVKVWGRKKILQASGKMRQALVNAGSPEALRAKTSGQYSYGTDGVPYASAHQHGNTSNGGIAGNVLPARPPLEASDDLERDIAQEVLRKQMNRAARDSGLRYIPGPADIVGNLVPEGA